jgi:hypothetical protein
MKPGFPNYDWQRKRGQVKGKRRKRLVVLAQRNLGHG